MAPIILYYFDVSGPCRIALTTIRHLGLDVEIRNVNLFKKEQFNEDFIKLNPQHTVPTLDDNGFILSESRAIAIYLVDKYFPDGHSLYPKGVETRALINQRLQFDCGTLFQRIRAISSAAFHYGQTHITDETRQKLFEAVGYVNGFLEGKQFVAGTDHPTIADLSILASIANIVELGADLNAYPNVIAWYERCKNLPGNAENIEGAKVFAKIINSILVDRL